MVGAVGTVAGDGLFRRCRVESLAAVAWRVIAIGLAALPLLKGVLLRDFLAEGVVR